MDMFDGSNRSSAVISFRQARRKADLRALLSRLMGKADELLVFDEVRRYLDLAHPNRRKLEDIPLDSIVGSVNRYHDFNRQFYPLTDSDENRWARVKDLMETRGLEPIEVYQIGEVYFVLDGNHRVSVARQMESESIEAYVTEFRSKIELDPDDDITDVVLKAEHMELMEDTHLDEVCPDLEIMVTLPGRYREIYEHIAVHRYYLGIEHKREIPIEEASKSWVNNVYLPVVNVIRSEKILDDFPGRTETDLYLWLKKHQWELENALDRGVATEDAAQDLRRKFGKGFWRSLKRFWQDIKVKDGE